MLKYSITLKEVGNHVKILHSVLFHCWTGKCPLTDENLVPRVKDDLINLFLRFTWSELMLLQIYQFIWFSRMLFTTIVTKNNISQCNLFTAHDYNFWIFRSCSFHCHSAHVVLLLCSWKLYTLSIHTGPTLLRYNNYAHNSVLTLLFSLYCRIMASNLNLYLTPMAIE